MRANVPPDSGSHAIPRTKTETPGSKKLLAVGKLRREKGEKWLPNKDSNLNKLNQNQLCYRYTIGHWFCNVH